MSRLRSALLIACAIAGTLCLAPSAGAFQDLPVLGDADGNGEVQVSDAVVALRIALGLILPFRDQVVRADVAPLGTDGVRGDDVVDVADVVAILRAAVLRNATTTFGRHPTSLYYEGPVSLIFPNLRSGIVRRFGIVLYWNQPSGRQSPDLRALLVPSICTGLNIPADVPVLLKGGVGGNPFVLEGGYSPVHPQVREREWVHIRLIAQNANGENPEGPSDIAGFVYTEEVRGLSPEPLRHEGLFVPDVVEVDSGFQRALRDPFFPKSADFSGPRIEQYRSIDATDEVISSALECIRSASDVVALTARPGDAAEFLRASNPDLGDGFDSLIPLGYTPGEETQYEIPEQMQGVLVGVNDKITNLSLVLGHSLNSAVPLLRRVKSPPDGRDLRALLRVAFTYSAIKTLRAERDLRGAQDAGLFSLPLGIEGEDGVLARCISGYTDALHSLLSSLAVAPAGLTGDVENNLGTAEETGLPVLKSTRRDHRLLLRILSGLSQARIELAQNALALQDWPQVLLQHDHMGMDIHLALALIDAQQPANAPSLARNQDLIATFENLSALSRLRRFAESRQTPASLLLGVQDTGQQEPLSGVGQEDYPDLTEPGDPALNRDVKTSLGFLVRQRIQEIVGVPGELDTLRNLRDQEQRLREMYLAARGDQREILNRRYDDARALKESLGRIVGFLPNGEPAVAPEGREATPENDAVTAALAAWDGMPTQSSWVYPWLNNQGSLRQTYGTIERLRRELTGENGLRERIRIQAEQISLLRNSIAAENELYREVLEAQAAGAQSMAEKVNEVAQVVGEAATAQQVGSAVLGSVAGKVVDLLGDIVPDKVAAKVKSNKALCYATYIGGKAWTGAVSLALPALIVAPETAGTSVAVAAGIGAAFGGLSGLYSAAKECKSGEEGTSVAWGVAGTLSGRVSSPLGEVQVAVGGTYQSVTDYGRQNRNKDVQALTSIDRNTFQIAGNTYRIAATLDRVYNVATGQLVQLQRVNDHLVSIDGHLVNIESTLGRMDERLAGIQTVVTRAYELQVKQYQEQLRQGLTLDAILQTSTAILQEEQIQTRLASYTVKELSTLNRLSQVEIISNAKLAAEGVRIRAIIESKMAQLETMRRNADLEARVLSLQGDLIALLSQFDSVRQQLEAATGDFFSLIFEAQRLKARWREALERQISPPSAVQLQRYHEAEEFRRYRTALARLRFKVWKLARLVEYMRNEPFPPFGSSVADTYSYSRFNYAMVFRARNAAELENALRALQQEAERVQGLQPASALVVSLRRHIAVAYSRPDNPALDDEGFRRFLREHNNRPISFAMTVGGALPLPQISGSDAQAPVGPHLVNTDRLNYGHLVWAVRVACETSDGSRITGNVHLLQHGTGMVRTADARPEEQNEYGLPLDTYREYHLPPLTSNVALSPSKTLESPTSELYDRPTDPARIWTFQFKNRPLVSVWEVTLPLLTEAQINAIKDIYLVFEVNVRSRPAGAR
ncbi:MAG: hypothetical protein QXI12_00450 [Candidatus Methanomethyliaceae archaeon]